MFAVFSTMRKSLRPLAFCAAALSITACEPISLGGGTATDNSGQTIQAGEAVKVALLIPQSDAGAGPVAASLENAARLAAADFAGANIELAVYDTAGNASTAAAQAQRAVKEGAKIILGPLFGEAANAAGLSVLNNNVNVLSFSNNPTIAGGNVFVLGSTFENTANRLMGFAKRQGRKSVLVVHPNDVSGAVAKSAIEQAASSNGLSVAGAQAYALSVEGVAAASQAAAAQVTAGMADTLFITTDATNAAMPMLLQTLPDNGATPANAQFVGLTRWDIRPDILNLPGAQGALFAVPNREQLKNFESRYASAYGAAAHPLAGLAYDGVAAIASLVSQGRSDALTTNGLTRSNGFQGTTGVFRLMPNGTNQRSLAIASVQDQQVVILDPAPNGFGGAGF